jgi:GntR family transcriptional regulator
MALWIQVSPGAAEPIFLQIVGQVSQAIATGDLAVGDKLPPIRKLAEELVLNPNTVARAYALLEQRGLVSTKVGSGTFVVDRSLRSSDSVQLNILAQRMDNIITQGITLGLAPGAIVAMFRTRVRHFLKKARKGKLPK